jgi:hypothetical protein
MDAPGRCAGVGSIMAHVFPWFVTPCLEAFSYLESRFHFDAPVVEQLGRECFIRYRKNDRWVSIAYEPGSVPIVELFHPTHDIKHRPIPRLKTGLAEPRRFADTDESQQRRTLQAQAADLEVVEREFLTAT